MAAGKDSSGRQLSQKLGAKPGAEVVVFFTTSRDELERRFEAVKATLAPADGLWIAWPKKVAGIEDDLTFEVVQKIGPSTVSSTTRPRPSMPTAPCSALRRDGTVALLRQRRASEFNWRTGLDQSLDGIRRCRSAAGAGEGRGDALCACPLVGGPAHGLPQPFGRQPPHGQPYTRAGDLDAAGDLRLVAPERDRHHGDAVRERLLGNAHPRMTDDARGTPE